MDLCVVWKRANICPLYRWRNWTSECKCDGRSAGEERHGWEYDHVPSLLAQASRYQTMFVIHVNSSRVFSSFLPFGEIVAELPLVGHGNGLLPCILRFSTLFHSTDSLNTRFCHSTLPCTVHLILSPTDFHTLKWVRVVTQVRNIDISSFPF